MTSLPFSIRSGSDTNFTLRYLNDFPIALSALFQAVEASCEDVRKLDPWYMHSHSLALKFFRHLSTVQNLCAPRIDSTTHAVVVDHSSVNSIVRTAYETFLIFAHIFGPEDKAVQRLRYALWSRGGLMERAKYATPHNQAQISQLAQENSDIAELTLEIDRSPLIDILYSRKQRERMSNGDWGGVNKVKILAEQAGLEEEHFQAIYKHSSGHTHSSYISALQVTQARNLEDQLGLALPALGTGLVLITYFLEIFCKLSPNAVIILKSIPDAQKILSRWSIQKEDWIQAREACIKKREPTWSEIVRSRGNRICLI